jgi:ribosomal protein L13E
MLLDYSVNKLKGAGCGVDALRDAGVSFDQLRLAGFEDGEILMGQLPTDFLKSVEYDASKLLRMGMALKDLVAAGLSALELRAAGFTVMELKQAGIVDVQELRAAGFDLQKLKAAFDIYELHDAGFTFNELQASGVDDKSLLEAGFGVELEHQALRELYITTNGPLWKVRLNWCTNKPLSQWFGIRTERDHQQNERVVAIDLTDNHLIGVIPERLWVLSRLRSLHLGLNFLTGSVSPLLANLLRTNSVHTDLHNPATTASVVSQAAYLPLSPPAAISNLGGVLDTDISADGGRRLDFDHADSPLHLSLGGTPMRPDLSLAGNTSMSFFGGQEHVRMNGAGASSAYGGSPHHENDFDSIDRSALMEFFHATNGAKWHNKANWGSTRPISEWKGVTVNKTGSIVKLVLPSNNLQGSIPTSIYYLESLREVDLRLNQLCGPIPDTIGHMRQLTQVYLQNNRLSGAIPETVGDLAQLQLLDLRSNQLSDTVPKSFTRLRKLKYLGLKSNLLKSRPIELQQMLPWCKIVT